MNLIAFVFFTITFSAFVWHIVSDRATPTCDLCEAKVMHTHETR